jgi:hypothetical protein
MRSRRTLVGERSPRYGGHVSHFLIVYDRDAGLLLRKQRYEVGADAMRARFVAEGEFAGRPEIEIVALVAESEDDLLVTHGRYFLSLTELVDRMS